MAGTKSNRNGQRWAIRTRVSLIVAVILMGGARTTVGSSFGFTIHHRFSDPVRAIFPDGPTPEKSSIDYFAAMAARDRIHGRRLADRNSSTTPLTFVAGNTTQRMSDYGFLYYANVSIGTPGLDFLVALDTGSDLLWLPCDCISCYKPGSGEINFKSYGLNTSSTGKKVPCSSPYCESSTSCTATEKCPYNRTYLSQNTSSSGYLVEDVMHLATDSDPTQAIDATVTFGCGEIQTGGFLNGGAPNGLLGLDLRRVSVPSILATQNLTADSFSMCFGPGVVGRISFGDKGSSDQAETPFVLQEYQIYFIKIAQILVGKNSSDVTAAAIFDTGTSFTYFTEPIYSTITSTFNSQVQDKRFPSSSRIPFEFCYQMSTCQADPVIPLLQLKMGGGANFTVKDPLVFLILSDQTCAYCLGIIKEENINFSIIGENFMSGYRIVFDRERKVLGWSESDCNYEFELTPFNNGTTTPTIANSPTEQTKTSKGDQVISHFKNLAFALFLLVIQLLDIL
ncbi:hypothetical protein V2J09_009892 [Rumex salicifolius]